MDEFFLKEMKTWGQSKISSYCFCVWCESIESGGRGSLRFPYVTLVIETSSDIVTFGIPSNINDGASVSKQPTGITQLVILKLLSYCSEKTIRLDGQASLTSHPVSRLIR